VSNAENQPTGHGPKGWLEKGKRVCLRRCSFVTYRTGYAPHSRLASRPFWSQRYASCLWLDAL